MSVNKCPWCADPKSEVEEGLCPMHEAELMGITLVQWKREFADD